MTTVIVAIVSFVTGAGLIGFLTFAVWRKFGEIREMHELTQRREAEIRSARESLSSDMASFESRKISYAELEGENRTLKADLRNMDMLFRKVELDRDEQGERQRQLDERSRALAEQYLKDVEKWVASSINQNNYAACKQRLVKTIEWCRGIGYDVSSERESQLLNDLKADFEKAVRVALEREEQARIKAQIREEQAREREVQKELERAERERIAIQIALDKALAAAQDEHSQEVELLRQRLAEAEANKQRAISQAQLTRSGHIYVISNIGSFGEDVYKIGMTRRLDPSERIKELGDASVPFPFDVHMMISADDAPALENALHKQFHAHRVNRVNPRKEYFRVGIDAIRAFVQSHHGEVDYTIDAEALEYRQSVEMSDEDQKYLDDVFSRTEQELGLPDVDE